MGPATFVEFCQILATEGGLRSTQRATVEEQVAKFLWIIGQDTRHSACSLLFHCSGETVSRHFHKVLEAIIELEDKYLLQPNGLQVPLEIQNHSRFYPYFKESDASQKKESNMRWTQSMDDILIDAYLHEHVQGNRVGGTFTSQAHDQILQTMKKEFPNIIWEKEKIQNHMKFIKKSWASCHDIFKNGLSGFAYDKTTSTWHAEPEVWNKLIESNPSAVEWRSKPVYNYDKLCELFAKDRVNGEDGDTPREMKRKRAHLSQNNVEYPTSVEDIDNMVAQNQASLNAINVEGSENDLTSPGCQSEVSSRKLKNRCRVKEDNNPIKEAISAMDRATQYLGDVLLLCANKSSSKDNELLEHLVEIGIEDDDELLRA
ncbi:hypothetical protein Pint_16893 [Pistacia integerrima]|uniref:Uncharacterized protein n=1 Tax=Pistacia integerrima TaxID=434235 RepID=A0ACC0ZFP6_9ROSI|nr:hypothetical protein Pint_16893 [Pistacia integerrima]